MQSIKFLLTIIFPAFLFLECSLLDNGAKKKRFEQQVGIYELAVNKTDLGSYDVKNGYDKLTVWFKSDSTFEFNMSVPFIYDSIGTWEAGGNGVEDWNTLYFNDNKKITTQFDQCCLPDSTFLMNSVTPKKGSVPIHKLYFKKLAIF